MTAMWWLRALSHSALPPRVSARMALYKTIQPKLQELWFSCRNYKNPGRKMLMIERITRIYGLSGYLIAIILPEL